MSQIFRVERTKNYTVMSNHHFKNENLSLKAKGLLSLMLSLPDDWNYNMHVLKFITIPINWCKEYIAWLEQLEYISNTAGEMLFKGFFSILLRAYLKKKYC